MNSIFPTSKIEKLKLLLGCLFMIMLIFSKYATSSCIILFIILAFYNVFYQEGRLNLEKGKAQIFSIFRHPAFWAITLIFWVTVLGYFNSENISAWLTRVRIRLPFIALPVVFFLLPWKKEEKYLLVLFSLFLIFVSSTGVIINYLLNFEVLNLSLQRGQALPVPMKDHIRYAQLQSFILLSGVYWIINHPEKGYLKKLVYILVALIFIYLHIIAVRSGLLIAYAGLITFLIVNLRQLKFNKIIIILILIFSIPFIAYKTIPSFQSRMDYAFWEINEYRAGSTKNNSDSGRWISYKIGWEYFIQNPVFGIGPGDLEDQLNKTYPLKYPQEKVRKIPHNQFLHTMAVSGIVGLLLFLSAFGVIIYWAIKTKNQILIVMIIATFSSFMVESPLEIARGTALIGFFLCFWTESNKLPVKDQKENIF
jgi:O-antigen ligase